MKFILPAILTLTFASTGATAYDKCCKNGLQLYVFVRYCAIPSATLFMIEPFTPLPYYRSNFTFSTCLKRKFSSRDADIMVTETERRIGQRWMHKNRWRSEG